MNQRDDARARIDVVGNLRVNRNEGENTGIIKEDEVRIALNKVKDGKAAGSDGVHTEMIKAGGDEVLKWLVRLFNACWINGEVPTDWKEVKNVRGKSVNNSTGRVKNENVQILTDETEIKSIWKSYFEGLLDLRDDARARIDVVGNLRVNRNEGENTGIIMEDEVRISLNKMKDGKAAGSDGVHGEMIKAGGDEVLKWLVRLFNACWINGEVPTDWKMQ